MSLRTKGDTYIHGTAGPVTPVPNLTWCPLFEPLFSIASEASYAYILSGQKFIKNAKNEEFLKVKKTVLPDRSILIGQKLVKNGKIEN